MSPAFVILSVPQSESKDRILYHCAQATNEMKATILQDWLQEVKAVEWLVRLVWSRSLILV